MIACPCCWRGSASRRRDIDAIVLGHLHFDHAGGLGDFTGAEIHCHADEWAAAQDNGDGAYFADDFAAEHRWRFDREEKSLCAGLRIIDSPGTRRGTGRWWCEPAAGPPVILAGDAADLQQNLDEEIAPGILWRDPAGRQREDLALASIRRLKALAAGEGAELWPNHDLRHWQRLRERGWATVTAERPRAAVISSTVVSVPQMPPSSWIIFSQARRISGSKHEIASAT